MKRATLRVEEEDDVTSRTDDLLPPGDVAWVVAQAARAPSIHNTQPWRFEWNGRDFLLRADTQRGLTVSDPDGRELAMSCGAALFNLKIALRHLELSGTVRLLPERSDPRVLAVVTVDRGSPVTESEQRQFKALHRRHTRRGGFTDQQITPALSVVLQEAAYAEGASLVYVTGEGARRKVLHLARDAERDGARDDRVRAETEAWTPAPTSGRRDGVPVRSYPAEATSDVVDLPGRDFDLGRGFGLAEADGSPTGPIGVLMTEQDLEADWLRAGQALESVLVTAASEWAFASLHSRVCEVPRLRAELRRELASAAYPQILLRIGRADTAPLTPRRSVDDIVDFSYETP